jgi:hypothetical protein
MRRVIVLSVGLMCLMAVIGPATGAAPVGDPPGSPRRLSPVLAAGSEVDWFEVSPGGSAIAFSTAQSGGGSTLWVRAIDGAAPVLVDSAGVGTSFRHCQSCFFVTGSESFVYNRPATGEFRVINPMTGGEMTRRSGVAHGASSDGRFIAFRVSGRYKTLDLTSGVVTDLASSDEFRRMAIRGSSLLLFKTLTEVIGGVTHSTGEEVWVVPLSGGSPVHLLGAPGIRIDAPTFATADGASIGVAYQDDVGDDTHVAVFDASSYELLTAATIEVPGLGALALSPDDRWLIAESGSTLTAVNVADGQTHALTDFARSGTWLVAPDSSSVVFTGREGSPHPTYDDATWFIYRVELDGSAPVRLTANRNEEEDRFHSVIGITPDEGWLVFLDRSYGAVLSRVPLAGGARTDLAEEEFDEYFGVPLMSRDGRRLAFVAGEDNPKFVMSMATQGGTVVNLIPESHGSEIGAMAITPDSRRVVFIARYQPNARELWVVDLGYRCAGRFANLVGTPGADEINGTELRDVIVGFGGDDVIRGRQGRDFICGGPGDDLLIGNGGRDVLRGQGGDDVLRGGYGPDRLIGGPGADTFHGGPGLDACRTDSDDGLLASCESVD